MFKLNAIQSISQYNTQIQHFLLFKLFVFYPSQNKFQFFSHTYLLSASAFNLDQSKNLLFGKELTHCHKVLTFNGNEKEAC